LADTTALAKTRPELEPRTGFPGIYEERALDPNSSHTFLKEMACDTGFGEKPFLKPPKEVRAYGIRLCRPSIGFC
jgi:hypothetical protein